MKGKDFYVKELLEDFFFISRKDGQSQRATLKNRSGGQTRKNCIAEWINSEI